MAFNTLKQAARTIYRKKGKLSDKKLLNEVEGIINETYDCLNHALETGFKLDIKPDEKFIFELKKDVWVFSACKSYWQLKEVSDLLTDDQGNLRLWWAFKKEVLKVHNTYNISYLSAEYNHATNSAYMGAKWQRFAADGDRYYLKYVIRGHNTRPTHAAMDGIVLPPSDPFWNNYLPPNDWNCFCDVKQVLKDMYAVSNSKEAQELGKTATTRIGADGTNKAAMFRTNPGKTKQVFGKDHPYHQNLPKNIKKTIVSGAGKAILRKHKQVKAAQKKYEKFTKKEYPVKQIKHPEDSNISLPTRDFNPHTGTFYVSHKGHKFDPNTGYYELQTAKILSAKDKITQLLNESTGLKQFDTYFQGKKTDIKVVFSHKKMVKRAGEAVQQGAESIVFYIKEDMKKSFLYKRLEAVKTNNPKLKSIWYILDNKLYEYIKN